MKENLIAQIRSERVMLTPEPNLHVPHDQIIFLLEQERMPFTDRIQDENGSLVIASEEYKYKRELKTGQDLVVCTDLHFIRGLMFSFRHQIFQQDQLAVIAKVNEVLVDQNGRLMKPNKQGLIF